MTDTKDKKREKLGILCCTAGATSWGLSGTCSEALFSQYPVDTTWVTAVRMTSAGIILLFLAFAKHSLNLKELGKDKKGLIEIVLFATLAIQKSRRLPLLCKVCLRRIVTLFGKPHQIGRAHV